MNNTIKCFGFLGKILEKIKPTVCAKALNLSNIKDGEHFIYHKIEFIRLGLEQGGVLCMAAKPFCEAPFDKDGCSNWAMSSARKKLNSEFLALFDEKDLLPFKSNLIADNGDTACGECVDKIGLLSCELYRKYRKFVPLFDKSMWTCTPWHCKVSFLHYVRLVRSDGVVCAGIASCACALAPVCVFRL